MERKIRIYLASSWRNDFYSKVLELLRVSGFDVYDFQDPEGAFKWEDVDPKWMHWSIKEYIKGLSHPLAVKGFKRDMDGLEWCDILILLLPCGNSAHLEAGWACGRGKPVFIFATGGIRGDLMYSMTKGIFWDPGTLLQALRDESERIRGEK